MTEFTLNGRLVTVADDHEHLLTALRDELGVMSPKDGCAPSGQCGCCTVLLDGKARVACQLPLAKTAGREVLTLEGLDDHERARLAQAFAATGALQCGFCTPGIVMRTKALLDGKGADLKRIDAARHLGAHLCRCTGYTKILDAVEALAADEVPVAIAPKGIGSSGTRYEAIELSLGDRPFIDDMVPPGLLHGAVHLAAHARADVVSIDTAAASAVEGVEAVFTAADVPGELRSGLIHKDWPVFIPEGGRTSYLGDVLAVVVAVDRPTARRAAELIEVTYDVLPPVTSPVEAVADVAPGVAAGRQHVAVDGPHRIGGAVGDRLHR
ncbi:MAG: 2Fe-2S iron-sulfur cluster-binding protein [Actinomycetota bacterium]